MLLRDVNGVHVHAVLEPPVLFGDLNVIATHLALPHPPVLGEGPVLQPIATLPFHAIVGVLILIPKLYGDTVVLEGEQFFAELIVIFFLPLPLKERNDLRGTVEKPPVQIGGWSASISEMKKRVTPEACRIQNLKDSTNGSACVTHIHVAAACLVQ